MFVYQIVCDTCAVSCFDYSKDAAIMVSKSPHIHDLLKKTLKQKKWIVVAPRPGHFLDLCPECAGKRVKEQKLNESKV